jgi:hypothetical protein
MLGDAADYQPTPISVDGVAAVGASGNFGWKPAASDCAAGWWDQQPFSAWIEWIRLRPLRFVNLTTALPLHCERPAE